MSEGAGGVKGDFMPCNLGHGVNQGCKWGRSDGQMQVDKSCMPTGKIGDWSGAQRSEFGLQSLAVPSLETLDL